MKVLLAIPHVFDPKPGSFYSSQTESKRAVKERALFQTTIGNLHRHGPHQWIHASLGKDKNIVTRHLESEQQLDITIQLFTPKEASLAESLPLNSNLQIIDPKLKNFTQIPLFVSKHLLGQANNYDLVGFLEDDLMIEDREFFHKILWLNSQTDDSYAFLPHRCEWAPGYGDVILSGDPDGGRPDLFWDTGEAISIKWPLGIKKFYRATNPHSGCYFLSSAQAVRLYDWWDSKKWISPFMLSGPLEMASSGLLLPAMKVMKTIPKYYRFLMVYHQDNLWENHPFEVAK